MKYRAFASLLALAALAAVAGAQGVADPVLAYSDTVQDITARFNAKLVDAQPYPERISTRTNGTVSPGSSRSS